MNDIEAIDLRHSVRQYLDKEIDLELREKLNNLIQSINREAKVKLHIFYDEPKCLNKIFTKNFENANNYVAIVGSKEDEVDAGYFGEKFVLEAQKLGLNTCFIGFAVRSTKVELNPGEKVLIVISFGYGKTQGTQHISRDEKECFTLIGAKPKFYDIGVWAALKAPTAINQQKFKFTICDNQVTLEALKGPFSKVDLGIVKYNFEIVTGIKVK